MKYLGIDYGLRKAGLAIGDIESGVAVPFDVLAVSDDFVQRIVDLCEAEDIDSVVVGVPDRVQGEITKEFIERLKSVLSLPVDVVGEAYTSVAGQTLQKEGGSGVAEDALAAMIILQEFFDSKRVNP